VERRERERETERERGGDFLLMFCVFFAKDDVAKMSKDFNDLPFDSFVFIFGFVWGKMKAQSISWCMGFSCFHRLLNSICSSYWDHVLKSHLLALPTKAKDIVFRFIIE
jgi:hypothetical protein